jgi:hypothetical protein
MKVAAKGIAEVIGVIMVLAAVIMATAMMMYYSSISITSISSDATTQFTRQTDRALESVSFITASAGSNVHVTIYNSGNYGFYLHFKSGSSYAVYAVNGQLAAPSQISCVRGTGYSLFGPGAICVLTFSVSAQPGQGFVLETSDGAVFSTILG